jgi:hypothetical protein
VFGDDLPPPSVIPVLTASPDARVAVMAASIDDYVWARCESPLKVEVPFVRVAATLLGAVPLGTALSAINAAMNPPCLHQPLGDYEPPDKSLVAFAAAVNCARKAVYAYAEDCWFARREVLIGWRRRAEAVAEHSSEWEAAMSDASAVIAEAEFAEMRLGVFEKGMLEAIAAAESHAKHASDFDFDFEAIAEITRQVAEAGVRHSRPSTRCGTEDDGEVGGA